MTARCRLLSLAAATAALLGSGCSLGPSLVPVSGTVKVDGRPTEGVQVSFWPTDPTANNSRNRYGQGMTGKDGRFELKAFTDKGLEVGEYKVTFTRAVAGGKVVTEMNKKADKAKQSLPARYAEQDSTDVTASVSADTHDFVFDLKSR